MLWGARSGAVGARAGGHGVSTTSGVGSGRSDHPRVAAAGRAGLPVRRVVHRPRWVAAQDAALPQSCERVHSGRGERSSKNGAHDPEEHRRRRHGEQHGERVQPQPGAEGERLDDVLDGVVREQDDGEHGHGIPETAGPVGDQGGEGAGHERPDVRHVARHERHERDRRGEGNTERPGAHEHDGGVGRADDRQAHGVAAEGQHRVIEDVAPELRRQADVTGRPPGDLGPVLEQEQQHEQGQHTAHDQPARGAEQRPQHAVDEQADDALRELAQLARALG